MKITDTYSGGSLSAVVKAKTVHFKLAFATTAQAHEFVNELCKHNEAGRHLSLTWVTLEGEEA